MGCYGLGIGRILASIIEQNNDENGIIFPSSIAPYEVCLVLIDSKDELQNKIANQIYDELKNKGVDVLLDDRDERPGVKFKDMDLIGIPLRITIGKKVNDNLVEFKERIQNFFKFEGKIFRIFSFFDVCSNSCFGNCSVLYFLTN